MGGNNELATVSKSKIASPDQHLLLRLLASITVQLPFCICTISSINVSTNIPSLISNNSKQYPSLFCHEANKCLTSNPLPQIVTSNPRLQPDIHFAVDMFPYKKTELLQKSGFKSQPPKKPGNTPLSGTWFYFLDINTTVSTWLETPILIIMFRARASKLRSRTTE